MILLQLLHQHIHRTEDIKQLCKKSNLKCQILNENDLIQENIDI